jgi:hypothetical protein
MPVYLAASWDISSDGSVLTHTCKWSDGSGEITTCASPGYTVTIAGTAYSLTGSQSGAQTISISLSVALSPGDSLTVEYVSGTIIVDAWRTISYSSSPHEVFLWPEYPYAIMLGKFGSTWYLTGVLDYETEDSWLIWDTGGYIGNDDDYSYWASNYDVNGVLGSDWWTLYRDLRSAATETRIDLSQLEYWISHLGLEIDGVWYQVTEPTVVLDESLPQSIKDDYESGQYAGPTWLIEPVKPWLDMLIGLVGARPWVKTGGAWQQATETYVKTGGVWKKATGIYIKSGAAWQEVK